MYLDYPDQNADHIPGIGLLKVHAGQCQSRPHDAEVSQWLAALDDSLLSRLRAVGLADGVGVTQTSLGEFLGRLMRTINGKPATHKSYGHAKRNLLAYFKSSRLLADITEADADAWRSPLERMSRLVCTQRLIRSGVMSSFRSEPSMGLRAFHVPTRAASLRKRYPVDADRAIGSEPSEASANGTRMLFIDRRLPAGDQMGG